MRAWGTCLVVLSQGEKCALRWHFRVTADEKPTPQLVADKLKTMVTAVAAEPGAAAQFTISLLLPALTCLLPARSVASTV